MEPLVTENTAVWNLKPEWWGSPLVQEKKCWEKSIVTRDYEKMLISITIRRRRTTTMVSSRSCINTPSLNTTILTRYKNLSLSIILRATGSESVHYITTSCMIWKPKFDSRKRQCRFFPPQRLGHYRNHLVRPSNAKRWRGRQSLGQSAWV